MGRSPASTGPGGSASPNAAARGGFRSAERSRVTGPPGPRLPSRAASGGKGHCPLRAPRTAQSPLGLPALLLRPEPPSLLRPDSTACACVLPVGSSPPHRPSTLFPLVPRARPPCLQSLCGSPHWSRVHKPRAFPAVQVAPSAPAPHLAQTRAWPLLFCPSRPPEKGEARPGPDHTLPSALVFYQDA